MAQEALYPEVLHLGYISVTSRLHLGYISTIYRLHVRYTAVTRESTYQPGLEEAVLYMTQEAVAEGTVVIQQGTKGEYFCVCQSGSYDVLVDGTHVHTYAANEEKKHYPCFGELALMYSKPRAASIISRSNGIIWKLGAPVTRHVSDV